MRQYTHPESLVKRIRKSSCTAQTHVCWPFLGSDERSANLAGSLLSDGGVEIQIVINYHYIMYFDVVFLSMNPRAL